MNIRINDSNEADADLKEISLEDLATTNSFDSLIKRNGRVLYTLGGYMKDGSQEEYTIYKDDQRYVVNDIGGTLIIEDIRARSDYSVKAIFEEALHEKSITENLCSTSRSFDRDKYQSLFICKQNIS